MLNWFSQKISIIWLKVVITTVAVAVIVLRIDHPDLKIYAITLSASWSSQFYRGCQSSSRAQSFLVAAGGPGFANVRDAGEKVTASLPAPPVAPPQAGQASFLVVAEHDPNLALVGLRIEIEKRVRALARLHNLDERRPLGQLLRELTQRELLPGDTVGGLEELLRWPKIRPRTEHAFKTASPSGLSMSVHAFSLHLMNTLRPNHSMAAHAGPSDQPGS